MMVGLKRDLRQPGEGLIYPQEVSTTFRTIVYARRTG